MSRSTFFVIGPIVVILGLATIFSQRWDGGQAAASASPSPTCRPTSSTRSSSPSTPRRPSRASRSSSPTPAATPPPRSTRSRTSSPSRSTRSSTSRPAPPPPACRSRTPRGRTSRSSPSTATRRTRPANTFIATDSVAAAKELGEHVAKETGGKGSVGDPAGPDRHHARDRPPQGLRGGAEESPGLKVVAKQPADWDQDKGFTVAQNMLQAHPDITVFFGQADAMALGAAQAVRVANVDHESTIVGFDGDVAGLKAVATASSTPP